MFFAETRIDMRSYLDAKNMAKAARKSLADLNLHITHGQALELVATQFGFENWNILAAKIGNNTAGEAVSFHQNSPIFRVFDEEKAKDFYLGFLGFRLDWEHRFEANLPLYMQVSRAGLVVHLSEHHGDASPGSTAFVTLSGVEAYQEELSSKGYRYLRPNTESLPWGKVMTVTDPFSNRIRFCEPPDLAPRKVD
ncbi:Glyoxalase family protein [Caballeronia sordidicola]|jgi:catechol 2,3-dioxygenase-like lactoylglutathione lyase family enzyme|uniref:Bleomycin resistance protein n=2 Tax=Caballeronia sordidicola TaxID=196367 RepID=A0A226WR26_CABSO|nr:Glyoxalase family protein [Caballeronia sordidicola]